MIKEPRSQSNINIINDGLVDGYREAGCLFALITNRRSVSRRNRASWFLRHINKIVKCDTIESIESDEEIIDGISTQKGVNQDGENFTKIDEKIEEDKTNEKDIFLVSITDRHDTGSSPHFERSTVTTINCPNTADESDKGQNFLVTTNTRVVYLSKSIATSIVLDLSPSIVSVSTQNDCVFLDSIFDALKRVLHLLVKQQEVPSTTTSSNKQFILAPKVFVTVIAYTPFVVAKNNQVLIQNRRISSSNIDQVLVEIWICLTRLTNELHELVSNSCGISLEYESAKASANAFVFPQTISGGVMRHPGSVLGDIYELGLFSASLMPRLSRLSILVISDGLFASSNNLNIFRLRSIAVSFVSLCDETISPDASFGYTSYSDLMRFVSRSTQGLYITHQDLISSSISLSRTKQISLINNPLIKLFCWALHDDVAFDHRLLHSGIRRNDTIKHVLATPESILTRNHYSYNDQQSFDPANEMRPEQIAKFFCIDQSFGTFPLSTYNKRDQPANSGVDDEKRQLHKMSPSYHDWRLFKQLERELDADFEQVLSCLLREGYLIKNIHIKQRETSRIVARLVLHWKQNLDLEQELTAPYWKNQIDPFSSNNDNDLKPFNGPLYGDTFCEIFVHGSYSFLHNLYCDRKVKKRSEYRDIAHKQFRQLIDNVMQTHERLQYLSRFYRDASLSKVPPFLLHGNSLLYEQPHTHKLTSMIENVVDNVKTNEFQEYWQKISCLDTKSWKNLMHVHALRLVLEHDQPKHKNINYQNANGRYTHILCRRALSAISNFIKNYASFALLEDSTYVKFIYNEDNDLREIETSATKGFIVIQINKLLPLVVIYLMFTSGILDSHRVQIVSYLEDQLVNCKMRNARISSTTPSENILKSKTIYPSSESCCVLIRSPLEKMLKVYSGNFVGELLSQNLSLGLPGSCPNNMAQSSSSTSSRNTSMPIGGQQKQIRTTSSIKDNYIEEHSTTDTSINRYNLVFAKYLYGVRVVHTVAHLPHDLVQLLASNVLAKISAILVNVRIKQGFHIAFNNSGILNLVVELMMQDQSHEKSTSQGRSFSPANQNGTHSSTCLCQYMVFPPTVTSSSSKPNPIYDNPISAASKAPERDDSDSRPGSVSGSLANSDHSFLMKNPSSNLTNGLSSITDTISSTESEVKVIREYWIEQQYGISAKSTQSAYHRSLVNMRYSEVVDQLFLTDTRLFDCLLTYDLLQMLCDKLSPFHELDVALYQADLLMSQQEQDTPMQSTASSLGSATNSSSSLFNMAAGERQGKPANLPSLLIEGNSRDGNSRVPLIEIAYKFSLVRFLDHCQQASLNVLLFKNKSEFYEPRSLLEDNLLRIDLSSKLLSATTSRPFMRPVAVDGREQKTFNQSGPVSRKMSIDVNVLDGHSSNDGQLRDRRGHRSSYDSLNYSITPTQSGSILNEAMQQQQQQMVNYSTCYVSLNQLFLETLHKRLRQMHDKELRLTRTDSCMLGEYLKRRKMMTERKNEGEDSVDGPTETQSDASRISDETRSSSNEHTVISNDENDEHKTEMNDGCIDWRCFMRKRNQENMMIVFVPSSLVDVEKWMQLVDGSSVGRTVDKTTICPIFVFRCSSTMLNERVLSFLYEHQTAPTSFENDLSLHFGQPCKYLDKLLTSNDELDHQILPLNKLSNSTNLNQSDEETIEIVHFRAFLGKIKNTVLKSRFSSLNDAYLNELFVHKDDLLYYIHNVDLDTQKKYHVSTQLKSISEFIRTYEDYIESLPKERTKPCNQLLNSILLQKCGIFVNQPIARFNESNPLMKQLQDRNSRLLFLMRCNYKIELPVLEEALSHSRLLKNFITPAGVVGAKQPTMHKSPGSLTSVAWQRSSQRHHHLHASHLSHKQQEASSCSPPLTVTNMTPIGSVPNAATANSSAASSLTNQAAGNSLTGARLMEMRYGSSSIVSTGGGALGPSYAPTMVACSTSLLSSLSTSGLACGSGPSANRHSLSHHSARINSTIRHSSASTSVTATLAQGGVLVSPSNESFILEAFKSVPCAIDEISKELMDNVDRINGSLNAEQSIGLRHEAHMAEVLRRKAERNESLQYRRVLKSKTNHSQSHSAIDQALKRVDNLGRLEHFCLTPLLFSPSWRSKLAPVRDHTFESYSLASNHNQQNSNSGYDNFAESMQMNYGDEQQLTDERWHQLVCNNYIKEYEQYIQTLGFKSVQIRYPSTAGQGSQQAAINVASPQQVHSKSSPSARKNSNRFGDGPPQPSSSQSSQTGGSHVDTSANTRAQHQGRRESSVHSLTNISQTPPQGSGGALLSVPVGTPGATNPAYNTGYLIKFLNSGCLVFKVGFCRPYVYSMLYSIEGERFSNSASQQHAYSSANSKRSESGGGALKMNNMMAFLDELDNIKVTMHLHSFTYDYHLRSMYSLISGRQIIFSPGYHLISFVDEFRKYYQKAPNYARNHILSGEVCVKDLAVSGQLLYEYIVTHNACYNLELLETSTVESAHSRESLFAVKQQSQPQKQLLESEEAKDAQESGGGSRTQANNYVLIELEREKVRYKDGKDPDIFDCGLLIAYANHPILSSLQNSNCSSSDEHIGQQLQASDDNSITLKYFLLLTNQRDLYPKLVHSLHDNVVGYHRPIRLSTSTGGAASVLCSLKSHHQGHLPSERGAPEEGGVPEHTIAKMSTTLISDHIRPPPILSGSVTTMTATTAPPSELDDARSSNDMFLSSGELSGPPSILSTAPSVQSALDGGLQFATTFANSDNDTASVDSQTAQRRLLVAPRQPLSMGEMSQQQEQMGTTSEESDQAPAEEATDALAVNTSATTTDHDSLVAFGRAGQQIARSSSFRLTSASQRSLVDVGQQTRHLSAPPEDTDSGNQQRQSSSKLTSLAQGDSDEASGGSDGRQCTANDERRWRTSSAASGAAGAVASFETTNQATVRNKATAICDEEITYLGYFSSDEMDMLKFLQEKTGKLRAHIERIVRAAEVHYRRDYLWQKLMQGAPQQLATQAHHQLTSAALVSTQTSSNSGAYDPITASTLPASVSKTTNDPYQAPLSVDELLQLLQIIHAVDLSALDKQLAIFSSMNLNWYLKLTKAFQDLKHCPNNKHRIYQAKASNTLLLFIDPKCCSAFVLLELEQDRDSAKISLILKDRQKAGQEKATQGNDFGSKHLQNEPESIETLEPDADCRQLINDFVNFCAAFMWSTLLAG